LKYDKLNYIIYQLDETIFDARQKVKFSWSPKNTHHEVPKTPYKFNKMQACMGVISSKTNELKYALKAAYFNSDDTIEFLTQLLNFHRHKKLCIFWDNCSIHTGKKVKEWMLT
jgi:hypothetical protein